MYSGGVAFGTEGIGGTIPRYTTNLFEFNTATLPDQEDVLGLIHQGDQTLAKLMCNG